MATVRRDLLHRPVQETARVLALAWLDEADAALEQLADPKDSEALHDFRVALRRFRSCVRAYQPYLKGSSPKRSRKRIQKLASATNVGRDSEVQIEWLTSQAGALNTREQKGLRWLLDTLEARRDQAYDRAQQAITRDFRTEKREIAKRLSSYEPDAAPDDPVPHRSFLEVTGELLDERANALRAHLAHVLSPNEEDEAHEARIEAKKLRYLIEPLWKSVDGAKPLVKDLKQLQDILGELHDSHVLTNELAVTTKGAENPYIAGLLALTQRSGERRDRTFEALEEGWLGDNPAEFFGRVGALAESMRQGGVDRER
jgi:CHAD domain-containing protein